MKKRSFIFLLAAMAATQVLHAQDVASYTGPTTQPYGKVSNEDLTMTACSFEKDANAEVLFDKGNVYFSPDYSMVFERHIRIKIFNDKGLDAANIKIKYLGGNKEQFLSGVQAETINLNNGAVEITKVDKKQMYTKAINKVRTEMTFAFPNVKAGSVIEYKYAISTDYLDMFPDWYFQDVLPTRYSELTTSVPSVLYYKNLVMVNMPFVKNTTDVKAMANVPSLHREPYMSSWRDNAQRILYSLKSVNVPGYMRDFSDSWKKVGEEESGYEDFGGQLHRKLAGEDEIVNKAKGMNSQADKIAYVFNQVKGQMKWDDNDDSYTNDGTAAAWAKKTGNSTEINMILCHLLQKSGVKALPMLVSTRENGKINPAYPSTYQFNRTVAYIPIDTVNYYLLDATNKYNTFVDAPDDLLNSFGLSVNPDNKESDLIFLQKPASVRQLILVTAEVKPDGKMAGTAQINSFSYNRLFAVEKYKTDGEEKYLKYLQDGNNDLKISNLKFQNMEVDTLPLTQTADFNVTLTGSDDNYIYINPSLFTGLNVNPFLTENRFTDIDFKFKDNYSISGIYKLPAGYKIDAMPKNANMSMSDNSIFFRRLVAQQDDQVMVRYTVDFRKSIFFKESYPELHAFYKKMVEMMNEQIVLKKS